MEIKKNFFKKLKLLKYFFIFLSGFFVFQSKKITPKSLLLIRLDAIGDYVLFRNFIAAIKQSEKYKDYKITLLGNIAWESLATELDASYIDQFIWLDRYQFYNNVFYHYKKLKEISSLAYDVLINPVYSRSFFYMDIIVNRVYAREKIGSIGDLSNIKPWLKYIGDTFYTTLLDANTELIFEFYRNKEFFELLLEKKLDIDKPLINLGCYLTQAKPFDNYVVLFLGASNVIRKWDINNFIEIANYINDKYGLTVVICGNNSDKNNILLFEEKLNKSVLNLTGKTSLLEMLSIIVDAKLLISNETCMPHFAVALDTEVIVISNGNQIGRFTPYPKEITRKYHVIFHPNIEKNFFYYQQQGYVSQLNINDISVFSVMRQIDFVLSNQ